jgi:hypothetical protein
MPSKSAKRARRKARAALTSDTHHPTSQDAFPGLPLDVAAHILNLADPRDLARVRAVSRGMRDAVAATGRQAVPTFYQVFEGGYLDWLTMADVDIELDEYTLCMAAANAGDLSMLKWLNANGCPWDKWTWSYVAMGGHLEIMKWARASGCPWDKFSCYSWAENEQNEDVMDWVCANSGCAYCGMSSGDESSG